jgi:hypothetical protein
MVFTSDLEGDSRHTRDFGSATDRAADATISKRSREAGRVAIPTPEATAPQCGTAGLTKWLLNLVMVIETEM